MRWQLGGNLQPVRVICDFDWRECPSAVMNYVWSEIVTDVVDCLTDESMIWRVIAMLFVCTLLVHTMYSKARWMDETTANREGLNVVGCKVQDLELKVNILTYKMQYGTWPLPRQIQATGIEGGLRNVRLTLTNSSDRSTWLKHMLLSPGDNATYLPYAKTGPRSMRCLTKLINLETKYMSSRFGRDASPTSNNVKSSRSGSRKSIKYERISQESLNIFKTDEQPIPSGESLEISSKDSVESAHEDANNCRNETQVLEYQEHLEVVSTQDVGNYSEQRDKSEDVGNYSEHRGESEDDINYSSQLGNSEDVENYSEQREFHNYPPGARRSESVDESPEERVNLTQGTLRQVTRGLENLHSVLRICGSPDRAATTQDQICSNQELAESILQDLKNLGSLPIESESDGKTSGVVPQLLDSTAEDSQEAKEEEDSASDFEQCQSNSKSSSARSHENPLDTRANILAEPAKSSPKTNQSTLIFPTASRDSSPAKTSSPLDKIPQDSSDEAAELQPSLTESSQTELSRDSDADGKSNATLFREALQFKKALLTQIELEEQQVEDRREQTSEESEGESIEPWPNVKSYFQSKLLDIISEEQSASSSTDKASKSPAVSKPPAQTVELQHKTEHEKNSSAEANDSGERSKLALVSESSEYFSLSNLEEKMLAQNVVSSTAKDTLETSSDFTEDELNETNETVVEENNDNLQKNISDLVNQSVQNIREYIEVFSKMQNDAIVETRMAIIDENSADPSGSPKNCSSDDSIMHFVNTVALVDSMSEELPRELPELPAINSLVDLAAGLSDESPGSWENYRPDFALKRRPGSISLAEQESTEEKRRSSSRSIFESAFSEDEANSEPSCNELVMDYLPDSCSDFADDKFPDTLNLIEFEEEAKLRGKDDERRTLDSPLTGRTVIRATDDPKASNDGRGDDAEFQEAGNPRDSVDEIKIVPVTEAAENPEAEGSKLKQRKIEEDFPIESTESTEFTENKTERNERPNSGDTVVIKNAPRETDKIPSKANLSSDTSGSYVDAAGSRDFSNPSRTSLSLDRSILRNHSRVDVAGFSKSARGSRSSPLQQRIPWTTPRRGSSLNSATSARPTISGRTKSKVENLPVSKTKSPQAKPTRSQSSGGNQLRAKSSVNLPERRSRSSATPRKIENSATSRPPSFPEKSKKPAITLSGATSSRSCAAKTSSKSCIPVLRSRIRAKSPMRGPLTMSTGSWREEAFRAPSSSPPENIQAEGSVVGGEESYEILKSDAITGEKLPDRTVIYVNIVTEQENSATRVVDPKKFLEYLKDRELKVQSVFDQGIGAPSSIASTGSCGSPRVLTVVSSAVGGEVSQEKLPKCSNNSAPTASWSLRVQQREIEVSAKPSVIDTSTSISDLLPKISAESRGNPGKFEIFEVPKELTKDEYIVLLEALNQDPNLHQLREMHKLCDKLGLGFHE